MSAAVVIHGFETSNNMKVRVALGYKGIPHDFRTIEPGDREEIVRVSGQHLTPVLQHGDVVLFDSAAILRYLEANFPDTPRLFGTSHAEQWALEDWELFARTTLAGPLMAIIHRRVTGRPVDDELVQQCEADFADALGKLGAQLGDGEWLCGDTMTVADVTAAPVVFRVKSAGVLPLPDDADPILAWMKRVMAHDARWKDE